MDKGRKTTYEELELAVEAYIHYYNNRRYQAKHKSLATFEVRNQALAAEYLNFFFHCPLDREQFSFRGFLCGILEMKNHEGGGLG